MSETLITIKTLAELQALQNSLADKEFIAFDTETTGVERSSEIIGFSVATDVETGYYVVLSYWDKDQKAFIKLETTQGAKAFMESLVGKSLIMQNAPFDCGMVEDNYGVSLMPSVHTDTLVLGHLLNENRANGLKERGVELYGEDARKEQTEMKESVYANGGTLTKESYELYKADVDLMAKYGAKDAILTMKVFYNDVPILYEEGLDKFFYEEETMPLLRGPTYEMNRTGLRVDPEKLQLLKQQLEADCHEAKGFINKEIAAHVKERYAGTSKTNTFNIGSGPQRAWLLFFKLNQEFHILTKEGKEVCKALDMKIPYSPGAKKDFIRVVTENQGKVYCAEKWNWKTKKKQKPKKIREPWYYTACGKEAIGMYAEKYKWAAKLLEYNKNLKLLNTYVEGIQSRMKYNIIRPSFLQHGTTSGRYSSKNPNFQNLPRDDKRVKACIVARPGKTFIGADQSQLEPRVFASFSQDDRLMHCFSDGDDFYSVVGVEVFDKLGLSLKKGESGSFSEECPELRHLSKGIALSTPYGTTAWKMAALLKKPVAECQEIINNYFERFPKVKQLMLDSHEMAKTKGVVYNLFGRPRRMPKALEIKKIYGNSSHEDLPYEIRNILNLAMNHRIQSTGASIMNRAAISFYQACRELEKEDPAWAEVKLVLQVHDELVTEAPKHLADKVAELLKICMEETTELPGVALSADPKIADNLKDLK